MEFETVNATIIAKTWCHEFKIGTKVKVKPAVTPGCYEATDENGKVDWVLPTEIQPD